MKKIMLVTGGSRGIGAATAQLGAERGYEIAVNYVSNGEAAQKIVTAIGDKGGSAHAFQCDVGCESDVVKLFAQIDQEIGPVTALVNNAGIVAPQSRLEDMNEERLTKMFKTNISGTFFCAREAVKRMSTKHGGQGGSIINMSSAISRLGGANMYVDYAASKGAIDTFTIGLAQEVAGEGVRVNALRPGIIDTEIHSVSGDPDRAQKAATLIPMQRAGTAQEVAQSALWLLSDEAAYITGALLDVSGGR